MVTEGCTDAHFIWRTTRTWVVYSDPRKCDTFVENLIHSFENQALWLNFNFLLCCKVKHPGTGNQTSSRSKPDSVGVTPLWNWVFWLCHCSWVLWVCTQDEKLVSSQRSNRGRSPQYSQEHSKSLCLGRMASHCDLIPRVVATCSSSNLSSTKTIYPLALMSPPCFQGQEKL